MEEELLKRWRLILGGDEADGTGVTLNLEEQRIDHSLEAVYDSDRRGGLGSSAPKVSRWLGDIREFFPQTVVQVIQRDAIKRLNLTSLLTEKEMLETVVPDVHLVATLMSLSRVIPEKNKEMAHPRASGFRWGRNPLEHSDFFLASVCGSLLWNLGLFWW